MKRKECVKERVHLKKGVFTFHNSSNSSVSL